MIINKIIQISELFKYPRSVTTEYLYSLRFSCEEEQRGFYFGGGRRIKSGFFKLDGKCHKRICAVDLELDKGNRWVRDFPIS